MRPYLEQLAAGQPVRYVSVGFASDYPDLCLITASNPTLDYSEQWMESTNASYGAFALPTFGTSTGLDPSLTQWNAVADVQGQITLVG
jgi:hypothetical protein